LGEKTCWHFAEFLGEKEAGKVVIVGNPRIDIVTGIGKYAYRKEIEDIQKRYGRFIIFNSFFALANGIRPIDSQLKRLKRMKKISPKRCYNTGMILQASKKTL